MTTKSRLSVLDAKVESLRVCKKEKLVHFKQKVLTQMDITL
jgi:hypothetical protein